jgi:hypothetical protein
MIKEIDICGILIAPFAGFLLAALLLYIPLLNLFDHFALHRFVWHRPLFNLSIFVIILSVIGLICFLQR